MAEQSPVRRVAYRSVDQVLVTVEWDFKENKAQANSAYPIYDRGVEKYVEG